MTLENKILLAKTIGESLYSGIICTDSRHGDSIITDFEWHAKTCEGLVYCFDFDEYIRIEDVKLYLRPMSSMTEEEKADLEKFSKQELDKYADAVLNHADKDTVRVSQIALMYKDIDWYTKKHFDYRGLIPMGLALPAPKNMYNDKN